MLRDGLTTWAEWNGPDSRSDCHAWGASPNFELLRTVAGIEPAAPAFRRVRVAPHLGAFHQISANMPHPAGSIRVHLARRGGDLEAEISLPTGIAGDLEWQGEKRDLQPGQNRLVLHGR
jgi:hypothetical protein